VNGATPTPGVVRIGVLGVNFGWGPHAALETIISEIRRTVAGDCQVVAFGSEYGRSLMADVVDEWCEFDGSDYDALTQAAAAKRLDVALVTLEGFAARAFEAAGVRTVFVDLMPFLWHGADLAVPPLEVSHYLALRLPGLSQETLGWMRDIRNLRWIGAVVPWQPLDAARNTHGYAEGNRRAIITLGGMLGLTMKDTTSYPSLVLPGAVEALLDAGFDSILIAGNTPRADLEAIVEPYLGRAEFSFGPLTRAEYRTRVAESAVCLSQPGLMSLLEASSCGTPLIRLPPQNVSGFQQAEIHRIATGAHTGVKWPADVVDEAVVRQKAAETEAAGNDYVYGAIADGARRQQDSTRSSIRAQLERLIPECLTLPADAWTGLVDKVGADGAKVAAEVVLDTAHALARN
jgi:hydroxymethylcytosylglucuronate/cytosylglucuronate synthase